MLKVVNKAGEHPGSSCETHTRADGVCSAAGFVLIIVLLTPKILERCENQSCFGSAGFTIAADLQASPPGSFGAELLPKHV